MKKTIANSTLDVFYGTLVASRSYLNEDFFAGIYSGDYPVYPTFTVLDDTSLGSNFVATDRSKFTDAGLYLAQPADTTFGWDAQGLLVETLIDGVKSLILAFRGTDPTDGLDAFWDGQTFDDEGNAEHYQAFSPLIEAAFQYIKANSITKFIVTGHSLGGTMADIFTISDSARFSQIANLDLTVVSLASAGLDKDVVDHLNSINSDVVDINLAFPPFEDTISALHVPDYYIGIAHSDDRVTFPEGDLIYGIPGDIIGAIAGYFPNSALESNIGFENVGGTAILDLPNIDNSDVSYFSVFDPLFPRGFGAEHNYNLYLNNISALLNSNLTPSLTDRHNIIMGVGKSFDDFLLNGENSDNGTENPALVGTEGRDFILGLEGDDSLKGNGGGDLLDGGAGNDVIDGGFGFDIAAFDGNVQDWNILLQTDGSFKVTKRFFVADEFDSNIVRNVELFKFDDRLFDPNKLGLEAVVDENGLLLDGPIQSVSGDLLDASGAGIGVVSIDAPTFMADGDAEYTLSLAGIGRGLQYNIAYIIDISGSMSGQRIIDARNAYIELTNQLINLGIADVATFAVIPFHSFSTLYAPLTGEEAIAQIAGLNVTGGTNFGPPLGDAATFFAEATTGQTNIAYFLSDGQGSGASDFLTTLANVQAFGIGSGANLTSLNIIDSDDAVLLNSSAQLADVLTGSSIDVTEIDRVEIRVGGQIVQVIAANQLVNGPLGLQFKGTLAGLNTDDLQTNNVTATVFLTDGSEAGTTSLSIDAASADSSEQLVNGDLQLNFGATVADYSVDGTQVVTFGIVANNLNNIITVTQGGGTIGTIGGNDRVIRGANANSTADVVMDGGDGFDIVQYFGAAVGYTMTKVGNLLKIGNNTDTLSNFELVEFDDVFIDAIDLSVWQKVALAESELTVVEGDSTFTLTFAMPDTFSGDVEISYQVRSGSADSNADFEFAGGSILIGAGQTAVSFAANFLSDNTLEGTEHFYIDFFANGNALFADGIGTATLLVNIEDAVERNFVYGTRKNDKIFGTDEDEIIVSLAGRRDKIYGGGGEDQFVFGSETDNGRKEHDFIKDFSAGEDSILLASGDYSVRLRANGALIVVGEDRDQIHVFGEGLTLENLNITIGSIDPLLV